MSRLHQTRVLADAPTLQPHAVGLLGQIAARLSDYLELTKPRIVVLELFVAAAVAHLASPHALDAATVLHALAGTALVAGSASIGNQWLERRLDARMRRTASRPCAAGRVSTAEAVTLAATTLAVGLAWLVAKVNLVTAGLGLASWVLYVVVYTPLKRRSPLNTVVGAVAGALPLLMGWTATGTPLDLTAWSLAGVLFLWQFPHFMAIAWLYRRDYAAAGHQMLSVVDPSGVRCGVQAIIGAALLIPVSLVPALDPASGSPLVYGLWSVLLGAAQLSLAIQFALRRDEESARPLLRGTLLYLPAWLTITMIVSV
ncbi:MAG TPA: heme o synthase [Lacipirellulaceae bacterium]|nr:heme o synthase [Lacipirellulaceae bacterium]